MINWVLQKNLTQTRVLKQIKAALNGVDELWETVEVIPFSREIPEIQHKNTFTIPYGSTTFMLNAFADENLQQGVFYDPNTFNMQNYVDQWKDQVLNSSGSLLLFGEIAALESQAEEQWFIRPNHDSKAFDGRVAHFEQLVKWSERICQLDIPELHAETPVWMAPPRNITKEWRLFIVDNVIVSVSKYMEKGLLNESAKDLPEELFVFAQELINAYRLADVYAMDIAQVQAGFKLIECNCFNGTGFYQHDIVKIIQSINHWVRNQYL